MIDPTLKPLVDRHEELDKELDKYFYAIEDMKKIIKTYEALFSSLSEEKAKLSRAIVFLEDNEERWYGSDSTEF